MTSYMGFKWPESGFVQAPDWDSRPIPGKGLHGLLWGEGDGSLLNWDYDAKWLVVEVDGNSIVDLGGKVKFPRGDVVFCGSRKEATDFVLARSPSRLVAGAIVSVGNHDTAKSGDGGTSISGDYGTSVSGDYGKSISGDCGTSISGESGKSIVGSYGFASAGRRGTATAGEFGIAEAGLGGTIAIHWWDAKSNRRRIATGYVGEHGIEPNKPYVVKDGKLVIREKQP